MWCNFKGWLQLHKKQPEVIEKPVLLLDTDARLRPDKWNNKEYLKIARDFGRNSVFITEVLFALEQIREKADAATTPEELKGCRAGLEIIKNLAYLSYYAQKKLNDKIELEEMSKSVENS